MLAIGSRGDVQPFCGLALALQAQGWQPRIAAAADYRALVEAQGLEFAPLVGQIQDWLNPEAAQVFQRPGRIIGAAWRFFRLLGPLLDRLLDDCRRACAATDMLLVSTQGLYCAEPLAEALGIPLIVAHFHPYAPTSTQAQIFFPAWPRWLPGAARYNRLSYRAWELGFWLGLQRPLNRLRRRLGLRARSAWTTARQLQRAPVPTLHAYSRVLAPPPADWPANVHITGPWWLERPAWTPPDALAAFLAAGPPPVVVSFGSMMFGAAAAAITRTIVAALGDLGLRGIIQRGWNELGQGPLPPSILALDEAPHAWLFERACAVVHHAGAGVTAAAVRAGRVAVTMPCLGDQHRWAAQLWQLGAGPAPIPRQQFTRAALRDALAAALARPSYQQRVEQLGARLAREDGIGAACALLDRYHQGAPSDDSA